MCQFSSVGEPQLVRPSFASSQPSSHWTVAWHQYRRRSSTANPIYVSIVCKCALKVVGTITRHHPRHPQQPEGEVRGKLLLLLPVPIDRSSRYNKNSICEFLERYHAKPPPPPPRLTCVTLWMSPDDHHKSLRSDLFGKVKLSAAGNKYCRLYKFCMPTESNRSSRCL